VERVGGGEARGGRVGGGYWRERDKERAIKRGLAMEGKRDGGERGGEVGWVNEEEERERGRGGKSYGATWLDIKGAR